MTAKEWFDALQCMDWVLIVTILLVFVGYIYLLVKIPQLEFVGGLIGKCKIRGFGILFGSLVITYLFYKLSELQPNEWVEISLLAGLVAATSALAVYAAGQAYTSAKMAEEMRDARYDTLRPVIDIVEQTVEPREMATRAYNAKEGIFPKKLSCQLRNIGVGPAIEVYSFIEDARGETCRWDFGAIPVAIGEEEMGYTHEMPLSLQQRGEHKALVAYYKDVYDNPFESSREVCLDREKSALKIGPLKIRPLPKEENIND